MKLKIFTKTQEFIDKIIKKNSIAVFFIIYFIFRISILNFNSAEWGDSYKILTATEYLKNWYYPQDEKRPPLFSIVLLLGDFFGGGVFGGRVVMLIISMLILFVFYRLLVLVLPKISNFQILIALLLFSFNPLFVYWSMRIYADSMFLLIALTSFWIFCKFRENQFVTIILAFLVILGIYTRFEGYILAGVYGLVFTILFLQGRDYLRVKQLLLFVVSFLLLLFGLVNFNFFHYNNPLSSSYFEEAESRSFQISEIGPTLLQLIFLVGIYGFFIMVWGWKKLLNFFQSHPLLFLYLGVFILLSLIWFPAVPRLFLQILPILIIGLVISIFNYFEKREERRKLNLKNLIFASLPILIFIFGQYIYKNQFLLTNKFAFGFVICISIISIYFFFHKSLNLFLLSHFLSCFFWMFFFILDHQKMFHVLNIGVRELKQFHFPGEKVLSNDVSALSKYYLNDDFIYSGSLDSGKGIERAISSNNIQYILFTNEHNQTLEFSYEKYSNFTLISRVEDTIKGKKFETLVLKVSSK
jgi:4-amino-4-deoxy-L-arabinose transferase-like glycosyltransferase